MVFPWASCGEDQLMQAGAVQAQRVTIEFALRGLTAPLDGRAKAPVGSVPN